MKKENNNAIVIVLMGIIIVILLILCILFATDKLVLKLENSVNINTEENNNENNNESDFETPSNDNQEEIEKDYSNFIGIWSNDVTKNEITIKNITNNEITFTWFLYRLAEIENETISFNNGKAIFFYQGYADKNYDGIDTEDEKYIRKATIDLTDNGVNVTVEDVSKIDEFYKVLDFGGSTYIRAGIYTHTNKYE